MKNVLKGILLGVLLVTAMSAVTVYRIRDIQGDKPGNKTLWEELRDRYTKTQADTTFVTIANADTINTYILQQSSLAKEINAVSVYNYVFPIGANIYSVGTGMAYADGRDIYCLFYVEKKDTITAISWGQGTQGAYTADAYNGIALYSVNVSSGLLTKIDSTVNDGEVWKGASVSLQTKSLTKTNIINPGVYAAGFVYNSSAQTTAPELLTFSAGTTARVNLLFPNSIKLCGYIGPTASNLPHTVSSSSMTAYSYIPYVLLR